MAGGRERGATPPQKATYLVADSPDAEDEDAGLELMEIFQGSPRFAPQGPDCCLSERHPMQPPSRQQNPVVKDQVRMRALIIAVCGRQAIAVADRSMCSRTGRSQGPIGPCHDRPVRAVRTSCGSCAGAHRV
jgi:hypothetical protein